MVKEKERSNRFFLFMQKIKKRGKYMNKITSHVAKIQHTIMASPWKTATDKGTEKAKVFVNDMLIPFLTYSLIIGLIVALYFWYQDGQADNSNFKKYLIGVVFIIIGLGVVISAPNWLWNFAS